MLSDGSQVGHVCSVLPLVGCKPAQLWFASGPCLSLQWWFAYLTSYGFLRWAMFVLPVVGCLLTAQLRTAGKEHVCIVSGGLLPLS
jgi:hypothetical protein